MLSALAALPLSQAQNANDGSIHWAYAAYFGTGRYEIDNAESTYTLNFAPSWEWRESSLDETGKPKLGYTFRLPIATSVHDFDTNSLLDNVELSNVSTFSVVPGVEIEIPMSARWTLKPMVHFGQGQDLGGSSRAWIHWLGIKSRLEFRAGQTDWTIVNALTEVGYSPNAGRSGRIVPLLTGFEFRRPLKNKRIGEDPAYLNWHVSYTNYLNQPVLVRDAAHVADISDEWELGIGFSKGDAKLKFWRLSLDQVGLAYRFDSDGGLSGIGVVFKSLFER